MKNTLLTAVALIMISTAQMIAQDNVLEDDKSQLAGENINNIVGFSYSTVSGAGITYQYLIDPNYRLKTSGFLFWDENTESAQEDILAYNMGGEIQRTIHRTNITRLYALVGGQYYFNRTRGGYTIFNGYVGDKSANEVELKTVAFGVGVGMEIFAWKNISLNADGNYYFEQTDKAKTSPGSTVTAPPVYREDRARRVRFGFGVGVGYAF